MVRINSQAQLLRLMNEDRPTACTVNPFGGGHAPVERKLPPCVAAIQLAIFDPSFQQRFWAKIDSSDRIGCWPWTARRNHAGYGQPRGPDGVQRYAHRVMADLFHGPIRHGAVVMHSCDNPSCCNPAHLTIGTVQDNQADKAAKGRAEWATVGRQSKVKLTDDDVAEILRRGAQGANRQHLAAQFGISPGYLYLLLAGKYRTAVG